jgi:hypothetical protein
MDEAIRISPVSKYATPESWNSAIATMKHATAALNLPQSTLFAVMKITNRFLRAMGKHV